jgi:hypothetical protein
MNDKKKLMVLGAMGVVFLGIGVMQFTKGSHSAPQTDAAQPAAAQSTEGSGSSVEKGGINGDASSAPQQNTLVTGAFAYRDPFKALVDQNARPAPAQQTNSVHPLQVASRTIPPFPGFDKTGDLPQPGLGSTVPIKPPAPEFGYMLAGVIMGRKPAAVFVDAKGAQHLIQVGGSLDGDTQLVSLDREHVTLRVKDQIKTLNLGGGEPSAK